MASPIEIYFPGDAPKPTEADLDRPRQTFRTAFQAAPSLAGGQLPT